MQVILALVAVAAGAPQAAEPRAAAASHASAQQSADATAETLKSVSDVGPESYSYEYETSNGIKANENGQLKQIGEEKGMAAQGGYSYTAPDGTLISVTYVADENGEKMHKLVVSQNFSNKCFYHHFDRLPATRRPFTSRYVAKILIRCFNKAVKVLPRKPKSEPRKHC